LLSADLRCQLRLESIFFLTWSGNARLLSLKVAQSSHLEPGSLSSMHWPQIDCLSNRVAERLTLLESLDILHHHKQM
jgi:hypothetical protein